MYFGATFEFRCDRKILDIQSHWNAEGPYAWSAFDNDQHGVYVVTRKPEINLKIKLMGEQPGYSLEIDGDVPPDLVDGAKATVLSAFFERLFAAIGATAIRDTSRETLRDFSRMAMTHASHLKDVGLATLTVQPKIRMRAVLFFASCVVLLGCLSYVSRNLDRAASGCLGAAAVVILLVQYRREHALIRNRLSATGVVTDYRVRGRGVPHLGKGVPVMKYEFVAFDQKTYHGETGWGTEGLNKGSQLTILYDPGNPARNHPLGGFVFYSFS